jgi:hypothetical protein
VNGKEMKHGDDRHEDGREPGPDVTGDPGEPCEDEGTELVRELLAQDAYALRPSPVPYDAVRRRGQSLRQRRTMTVWGAVTALAVVPAAAYAVTGHLKDPVTLPPAAAGTSHSAAPSASAKASPSPAPSGPARPATADQLLDGITFEEAAKGLGICLGDNNEHERKMARSAPTPSAGWRKPMILPAADHYRIILATRSTGDSNTPGDGYFVVAVKNGVTDPAQQQRLICNVKDDKLSGLNTSAGDSSGPDSGLVVPDINAQKLYMQSVKRGPWKLPFRWSDIGTVGPSVTRVTVSYGGGTSEATLDHGWFVASGVLEHEVTVAPRVKGYDGSGKLVYDSDRDKTYARDLP